MLDAFWSGLGEELAARWVARILTPAFGFWVGGLFLVWSSVSSEGIARDGWVSQLAAATTTLQGLPVIIQICVVIGGLILIAISALIAERMTRPLIRLLEGYWYRPLAVRSWMIDHRIKKHTAMTKVRNNILLKQKDHPALTDVEDAKLAELRIDPTKDVALRRSLQERKRASCTTKELAQLTRAWTYLRSTPNQDRYRMPTRLGDLLRAAELRPKDRYGLDAIVCWPALWLLLPAETRTELIGARTGLDGALRAWLWGALFLVWTPWSWWALVIGIGIPLVSYRYGIIPAAAAFGELMVTAFDLNRIKLYDALHLPRPASARQERTTGGPQVTAQLSGVLRPDTVYRFTGDDNRGSSSPPGAPDPGQPQNPT